MCEFNTQAELFTVWNLSWNQILSKFKTWQKYNLVQRAGEAFGFLKPIKEERKPDIMNFLHKLPRAEKGGVNES